MGKKIRVQRRGRGTSVFRALTHKRVAPAGYPPIQKLGEKSLMGRVEKLIHDPGRGTPLALIKCENGLTFYNLACENMYEGQEVCIGAGSSLEIGNTLPLSQIPEGTFVYNVEKNPSDGGKFARTSGGYATIVSHIPAGITLKLPSGKTTILNENSLATIGVVAAAGRIEKPFLKAGEKHHLMRAKGRKYPMTKGVAMVAAVHPYGGGRHKHPGKPKTVSRFAPPGRKIGLIAARVSGRARRERAKA